MRAPAPLAPAALAVAGLLIVSGCGVGAVTSADLEQAVADATGLDIANVDCPDELPAEVDAATTCTIDDAGEEITVDVTVTSVDDDQVNFDIVPQ